MARKQPIASALEMDDGDKTLLYKCIENWHEAAEAASVAKAREYNARMAVAALFEKKLEEGTNTVTLDYGKALKIEHRINRSVDRDELEIIVAEAKAKGDNETLAMHADLFRYKPELSVSAWKADEDARVKFSMAVIEKPGSPSLSIVAPK